MPIDWGQQWLQATPEAQFQTAVQGNRSNWTPAMSQYWGGQFGNMYNRFLGNTGQRIQGGQDPQSFGNFLGNQDWRTQFQNLPRWQQGFNQRQFAPSLRYLLY